MGDNLTMTTPLGLTFALKLFLNVPRFLCSKRSRAFASDVDNPTYQNEYMNNKEINKQTNKQTDKQW